MKTRRAHGFTLIEVLIAGLIFAQVALVGAATLASVYRAQNQTAIKRESQQAVRLVLETMTRDLHWADTVKINGSGNDVILTTDTKTTEYHLAHSGTNDFIAVTKAGTTSSVTNIKDVLVDNFRITGLDTNSVQPGNGPLIVSIYIKVHSSLDPNQHFEATALATPRQYKD